MEFTFMKTFFDDKEIMNPTNPDEVFTCKDLMNDYNLCRKERHMEVANKNERADCWEYRKWANRCFVMSEDAFVDKLLNNYEEKVRYADFLEREGSIMAESQRKKQNVFRIKDTQLSEQAQHEQDKQGSAHDK